MSYTAHPGTTHRISEGTWHVIGAIAAVLGVVAAAVGALLAYGPNAGTLTVFAWTWNVSELSDMWAPFLMMGGGFVAALTMGIESLRGMDDDTNRWVVAAESLIALAGLAALVIGFVLLF
ncbi:MAG: hypothetical protein WB245_09400 [Acidimicrobiia bacterium]